MDPKRDLMVMVDAVVPGESRKSLLPSVRRYIPVKTEVLGKAMEDFVDSFLTMLETMPQHHKGYEIDEVEVSLGIDAGGKISLIGEVSSSINSSIRLKCGMGSHL